MAPALPYAAVREGIQSADVLLWRGRALWSWVIRWWTRSEYSHAGIAVWVHGRPMAAESRECKGCRLLPLSAAIKGADVDLFQVRPEVSTRLKRGPAVQEAISHLGEAYGWRSILRIVLTRLPFGALKWVPVLRHFVPHRFWSPDDYRETGGRMICSEYVARCYRLGGLDLVPNLRDPDTTPGDIARD